ncbi:hypothetical protein [Priestia megaterium]|uniref:TOTE conflict system archaeo-eukaryotic primase domain-containing protein n=1 Tax=Priestia megaterium TaxID=1404 RepID=UPI0035A83AA7
MTKKKYSVQEKIRRINELYITYRKQYITQNEDGTYKRIKWRPLNDLALEEHLIMKETVGILSGSKKTRCLVFDVDFKNDLPKAEEVTRDIVFNLEHEFFIGKEQVLVSFSGNKGYHVTIFFNDVIEVKKAKLFYEIVLEKIGCTTNQVERRPLPGIGVKLPLSINKKTGKRCYLVDPNTLYEISDNALFEVEQVDKAQFEANLERFVDSQIHTSTLALPKQKDKELKKVVEKTNFDIPVDYEERCINMLEDNCLLYEDSRHVSTLLLLTFLKERDYERDKAVEMVQKVIENTFITRRHLIDQDTTKVQALNEVERISVYVYGKGYNFANNLKTSIRIHENEILEVLKPKPIHLKQLAFIMLVHSKKYAKKNGIFYMTYKQMAEYGAAKNRTRLLRQLMTLEKEGLMEIVERDRKKEGQHINLPNRYRVCVSPLGERFIEFDIAINLKKIEFKSVVTQLIPSNELKKIVSKEQFYTHFKPNYIM